MTTFMIRSRKKSGVANLYVRIQSRRLKLNCCICTYLPVDIEHWRRHGADMLTSGDAQSALAMRMWEIRQTVLKMRTLGEQDASRYRAMVRRIGLGGKEQSTNDLSPTSPMALLDRQIAEMGNGHLSSSRGKPYARNTRQTWRNMRSKLADFLNGRELTWQGLDRQMGQQFVNHLAHGGLKPNTIRLYASVLRTFVRRAYHDGLHANGDALDAITLPTDGTRRKQVYLTASELTALERMPLRGGEDAVRDVFLMGCYTAQRFSDYSRLAPENFITTVGGTPAITLTQRKTGARVTIPYLYDNMAAIARKRGHAMPRVSIQHFDRTIKRIVSRLAESVPSLRDKATHVASHTARRTGITLLYLSHRLDMHQLMAISGHKTQRILESYIKASSEEMADDIARAMADAMHTCGGSNK